MQHGATNGLIFRASVNRGLIDQAGLDVQATLDATLLKLEAITRDGHQGANAGRFAAVGARFAFNDDGDSSRIEIEGGFVLRADDRDTVLRQYRNDSFLSVRLMQYL